MASEHIVVPSTNRHNQAVGAVVTHLTEAIAGANKIKAILDKTALGGDYASLAVLLDMSGPGADADAELVINYLTNVIAELAADTDIHAFISRCG